MCPMMYGFYPIYLSEQLRRQVPLTTPILPMKTEKQRHEITCPRLPVRNNANGIGNTTSCEIGCLTIWSRGLTQNFQSRQPLQKDIPPSPPPDLPEAVPISGEIRWGDQFAPHRSTEAIIREGSEFMDHWEVQIESSEDAAGA